MTDRNEAAARLFFVALAIVFAFLFGVLLAARVYRLATPRPSISTAELRSSCKAFQQVLTADKSTAKSEIEVQDEVDRVFQGRVSTVEARLDAAEVLSSNAKSQSAFDIVCKGAISTTPAKEAK